MDKSGEVTRPPEAVDFLGVPIARLTAKEFISWFCEELERRAKADPCLRPLFVTYLNAACSNLAEKNKQYCETLRSADLVYADGQAIVWASKFLGDPLPERVNAADFFPEFCAAVAQRGWSLYLVGSPEGVAAAAAGTFQQLVPHLRVSGTHHGYFDLEDQRVVEAVRASGADILVVGMGVPRQELWAKRHLEAFGVKAVWCVGAMFEYFAGYRARAPRWMRRAGLEWLFRLVLEPRRLWRRYVIGNTVFIFRVLRARFWSQREK
ncbi:MAG: glycosyltransferase [Candidatus Hydrogenedentota bacterium]|uniref:N-acetylmannosaminyltransferase n=1 Tax=Sumerlaea chitinivorans TaxID=2250252 RepID=A0A2Z4Y2S2_SUMC1|nr:N-acetylmannosaminyltransferase [Candidatus Sumerlaea chitinivorans]RMH30984.1 MAG: glycosyltransferase [Candidatus Hydrogenedentota bacterium]GIX45158.1 MAG: hypothetical protein KatS3mg130_1566 [Candidatus Sumerlaea sp.]